MAPNPEPPERTAPDPDGTAITPVPPPRPAGEAYLVPVPPRGSEGGHHYPLGRKPVVIGRTEECAIVDPHPSVSRRHAIVLLQSNGRFLVTDVGSTNGTFVNDVRVESAELADGDHVRFGSSGYRFLSGGGG